jgi:hypothetical protein
VFTTWVCPIQKSQTSENEWEKSEKQFAYLGKFMDNLASYQKCITTMLPYQKCIKHLCITT